MKRKVFESFKEARDLASSVALYFGVTIDIKIEEEKYVVTLPKSMCIPDIKQFSTWVYLCGPPNQHLLSLLEFHDKAQFSSRALAWRDFSTGLTWDIARLIYGNGQSEHPKGCAAVMNALRYAGCSNWRLPTLQELKTLSVHKLSAAGIKYSSANGKIKFWSCEESMFSGPEKAFCDLASMRIGHQRFIEQDRNKSTFGDGYTEKAQTIMVTSEIIAGATGSVL